MVSLPSPQPPFKVPQRFWDMYPLDDVPTPVQWRREERPDHPADAYVAWVNSLEDDFDEEFVRRVVAGYCSLISQTGEQIGRVLHEPEALGLVDNTRIVYTGEHGEAAGHDGISGKRNNEKHALSVPLLIAGPHVPQDKVVSQCVSQVDLFPTIPEAVGAQRTDEDSELPGVSLWPAMQGNEPARPAFAEYQANGRCNSGFAFRKDNFKLIDHVGMRRQLFDLGSDPLEERDLLADGGAHPTADKLESGLRQLLAPKAVDARSKADQAAHMEKFGGVDTVRNEGMFSRSSVPGSAVELERAVPPEGKQVPE
jgi:choline-sulfatase